MIKRIQLFHPFLFAILPAIFLWGRNFAEVFLREVPAAVAVLVGFGAIVFGILRFFLRDPQKAAPAASLFLLFTLSFEYIYRILFNSLIKVQYSWALIILLSVFIFALYAIRKTAMDLSAVNHALFAASGMFVLLSFFRVGGLTLLPSGKYCRLELK